MRIAYISGMRTHQQILDMWPSKAALARELKRPTTTVMAWFQRNSIPGEADVELIEAAEKAGYELTFEDLALARASRARSKEGAAA